jgi:hypothetical protein
MKKTNDQGIKKWLEQTGVDWCFLREPRERAGERQRWTREPAKNLMSKAFVENFTKIRKAMRKAGLI